MHSHTLKTAHLVTSGDAQTLPLKCATVFCYYLREVLQKANDHRLRLCLSGGTTPFGLYHLLTQSPWQEEIPWNNIDFFFGDERFVPYSDDHSNYGRIKSTLFDKIGIHPSQIFAMPIQGTPQEAASNYNKTLCDYAQNNGLNPQKNFFDLTLLGMGSDGHTASLFPGEKALTLKKEWVSPSQAPTMPHQRLSLTYPILNASRFIMFMINGEAKRKILTQIRQGDMNFPASHIRAQTDMTLLTDKQTLSN